MASVASGGTAERIAARTLFKVLRAGSGTAARYSSVFFVGTLPFAAKPRAPGLAFFIRGILLGRSPRVYASNLDAASLKNGRDRPTRLGISRQSVRATTSSGVWRSSALGAGGPYPWSYACVKRPMSIFFILSIASMTLFDFSGSGSPSIPPKIVGLICQDSPYLSFSQPHCTSSPPSESLLQNSSTSSCVLQSTENETASVNLKWGPPFNAMNSCPPSTNVTVITLP